MSEHTIKVNFNKGQILTILESLTNTQDKWVYDSEVLEDLIHVFSGLLSTYPGYEDIKGF